MNSSKKVILFGITPLKTRLESFFSKNYEIVGYCDFDEKFKNIKYYEYKNFYTQNTIKDVNFDYIIVCYNTKKECDEFKITLENLGIPSEKIILPYCLSWSERMFRTTLDDFEHMDEKFEGLIFGMSYSQIGLLTHCLDKKIFKFSMGGVDLYTNEKWISYLVKNKKELLTDTKYVILDLPYYIFNWDITRSNQIYHRMLYYDKFDNYRYAYEKPGFQEYISNYRTLKKMFGEKFEPNTSIYSNNQCKNRTIQNYPPNSPHFSAVGPWLTRHETTIEENKQIFQNIINLIKQINSEIKIAMITFPYCKRFLEINKQCIEDNQKYFYEILDNTNGCENILKFDFIKNSDNYTFDDALFGDTTHLNGNGAEYFSNILNEIFKAELY